MSSVRLSVLITGASTGIGQATAVRLAKAGHQVFAGVRKAKDGDALKALDSRLLPIIIDVAKSESIQSAFETIKSLRNKNQTFCLVNNAGIVVAGPVEALKMSEWRKQMDVNFFGLIETTKTFLPFIRDLRGRVINISSINGRMAAPFMGAYSASKFAVEALSDALRIELAPFGIKVTVIQPGPIATPIWAKGLEHREEVQAQCEPHILPLYLKTYERFEEVVGEVAKRAIPVETVAAAIEKELLSSKPAARVVVAGKRSHFETVMSEWLPESVFDKLVLKEITPKNQ